MAVSRTPQTPDPPARAVLFALGLSAVVGAHAQDSNLPSAAAADALDTIVVVGTRTPRAVIDQTATVSVVDAEELKKRQASDLRDALRYEPGVNVRDQGSRFGLAGVNIRGIEGNRVNLQVDGVRVSQAFSIGDFSNAGRDFVDIDALKQIEVLRGPASSLYGSDALGGVVRFVTLDPTDLFADGDVDRPLAMRSVAGYDGSESALRRSALLAGQNADFSALLTFKRRDGEERETAFSGGAATGAARVERDPTDFRETSVLGKLVYGSADGILTRLTLENTLGESNTEVLSSVGRSNIGPSVFDTAFLTADDETERRRATLDQSFNNLGSALADRISWQLDAQYSDTDQRTRQQRSSIVGGVAASPRLRERRFLFEERSRGGELLVEKAYGRHHLSWGGERLDSDISGLRDGRETNLATGAVSSTISPDTFPVRDFPRTDITESALFVQDEWRVSESFRVIPAVRHDRYELDPRPDAIFLADNPGVATASIDDARFSPKLGLWWQFAPGWNAVAQLAQGYRSPPFNDVNIGFTNFPFGYTAIANPDLKPERSTGVELGLRWQGNESWMAAAAYQNRYRDFIESLVAVGNDPTTGLIIFQSRNVNRVRIRGVEFSGGVALGALSEALRDFRLQGALSVSDGENAITGEPLSTVDPARATVGLGWQRGALGLDLVGRFAQRQDDLPAPATAGALAFEAGGYGVLDLYASWNVPRVGMTLDIGLRNLLDKTYWEAANVRGRNVGDVALSRFTEPGRTFTVAIRHQF